MTQINQSYKLRGINLEVNLIIPHITGANPGSFLVSRDVTTRRSRPKSINREHADNTIKTKSQCTGYLKSSWL